MLVVANRNPDNEVNFENCRNALIQGCAPDEFTNNLISLKPTPAQIFRLTEITHLAQSNLETKYNLLQKMGEYLAKSLREVTACDVTTAKMVEAFIDAARMLSFCQDEISKIMQVKEGRNEFTAEELRSYLLARHQDVVRHVIDTKRLAVENREVYIDPAPKSLGRSRDDFLIGKGTYLE
jgi:hypothetical protein